MFPNKGHKKDNKIQRQKEHLPQPLSSLEITSIDQHVLFIAQKSEKITVALYMITDFLKDKEPFKWEVREKSVQFLSFISSFSGLMLASQKEKAIADALSLLSLILSLLRFGVSARFISQMNYSILKDEYNSLYETLHDRLSTHQPIDGLVLPQDFFDIKNEGQHIGHIQSQRQTNPQNVSQAECNDKESDTEIFNVTYAAPQTTMANFQLTSKKEARQDIIMKILRTKGATSIKDISEVMSGCGEKTIQRELISLINNGLVHKIGERRWSKYTLSGSI